MSKRPYNADDAGGDRHQEASFSIDSVLSLPGLERVRSGFPVR